MAVAYWSFKMFCKGISASRCYVIKYKNVLYYVDNMYMVNLNTLEYYFNFRTIFILVDMYKINNEYLKDIWGDVEIVRERIRGGGWLLEQLTAARRYKKEIIDGGGNPYDNIDLSQGVDVEKKSGMAIQYISYEKFIEVAYNELTIKDFSIKYDKKIYFFRKKINKYEFGESYPAQKLLEEYSRYEDLFSKPRINGKTLEEVWDDCEYIINKKVKGANPRSLNKMTSKDEINELNEIVYEAQKRLIKQEKIPFMRMSTDRFVDFSQVMVLLVFSVTVCFYAASVLTMFYDILWLMSDTIVSVIYNLFGFGIVYFAYTTMIIEMPQSIIHNIKKHWKTWLFMLVFEVIYCFKILPFTLLMNIAGLLLGYVLNWIDVKVRLRYAQKVKDGKI